MNIIAIICLAYGQLIKIAIIPSYYRLYPYPPVTIGDSIPALAEMFQ